MYVRAIEHFGGASADAADFPATVPGLQAYLDAVGVRFFSARELTRPNHPDIARRHGFEELLPEQDWWERGAALALVADRLRTAVGEPVRMRNWWRPKDYNRDVKGASGSDHVPAKGVDLDYRSVESRRTAEAVLWPLFGQEPWLEMSLGLGAQTTHVGLGTRRRCWCYGSYLRVEPACPDPPGGGRCTQLG